MGYRLGTREFEAESRYLTLDLRESNDVLDDPAALRARLAEDGYLFIRGLHDRDEVLQVRREILERMAARGALDPAAPLMDGVARPAGGPAATSSVRGNEELKTRALRGLVYGPRVMGFFARLLGGEAMSFKFQWLRVAAPGAASGVHADVVYMGRGTHDLYTCWTPIGDVTPEMGPLVLCLGSHAWKAVRETYGRCDVDRDLIEGIFTRDPAELVDRFGGRWATARFRAGDVLIQSIYMLHASLTNVSNRYRISCDNRYQRIGEPVDDRWSGDVPRGHDAFWHPETRLEPVEVSRARWGV
jgi:hypothetical protein